MNQFEEKAEGIFARFTKRLAKVDLRAAVAVPAAIGLVTVMAGVVMEMNGQSMLLQQSGLAALNAYKDAMGAMQLPVAEWLTQGISGKLQSFGDNAQAKGFALMAAAPVISAASVVLARGFTRLKDALAGVAKETQQRAVAFLPAPQALLSSSSEQVEAPRTKSDRFQLSDIGGVEMLQRLARAYQVDVASLKLSGDNVMLGRADERRVLCTVGSRFWQEVEQDALAIHALAHKKGLNPDALYVRNGTVFELDADRFVDRVVVSTDSDEWAQAELQVLDAHLDEIFGVSNGPQVVMQSVESSSERKETPTPGETYGSSPDHHSRMKLS
jgi:hypothetical protein